MAVVDSFLQKPHGDTTVSVSYETQHQSRSSGQFALHIVFISVYANHYV